MNTPECLPNGIKEGGVKLVVGEVLPHLAGDLDLGEGFSVAPPNMPDPLVAGTIFVSNRPGGPIELRSADFFNKSGAENFNCVFLSVGGWIVRVGAYSPRGVEHPGLFSRSGAGRTAVHLKRGLTGGGSRKHRLNASS